MGTDDGSKELTAKAASGDPASMFELGKRYYEGIGIEADIAAGIESMAKAAENGYAPAQNYVGALYAMGENVVRNDETAFKWISLAADQGFPKAQHNLGLMYGQGRATERNERKAAELFKMATDQGYVPEYRRSVKRAERNDPDTVKELTVRADGGDLAAIYMLAHITKGMMSQEWYCKYTAAVKASDDASIREICRAATIYCDRLNVYDFEYSRKELEDPDLKLVDHRDMARRLLDDSNGRFMELSNADPTGRSEYEIAAAYCRSYRSVRGRSCTPDPAMTWYRRSMEKGYFAAYSDLGNEYASRGKVREALGLLEEGYDKCGSKTDACRSIVRLCCKVRSEHSGSPAKDAPYDKKAFEYAVKGVELGDGYCSEMAGNMCFEGCGTEQGYGKALEYLTMSQPQFGRSYLMLGRMFEEGLGVEKDTDIAMRMYHRAADRNYDVSELLKDVRERYKGE